MARFGSVKKCKKSAISILYRSEGGKVLLVVLHGLKLGQGFDDKPIGARKDLRKIEMLGELLMKEMMNKKNPPFRKKMITSLVIGIYFAQTAYAEPWALHWYYIKQGDTLGHVLYRLKEIPVWGNKGSLKKTLAMNPNMKHNGDLIQPGEKVVFHPFKKKVLSWLGYNSDGEIYFKDSIPRYPVQRMVNVDMRIHYPVAEEKKVKGSQRKKTVEPIVQSTPFLKPIITEIPKAPVAKKVQVKKVESLRAMLQKLKPGVQPVVQSELTKEEIPVQRIPASVAPVVRESKVKPVAKIAPKVKKTPVVDEEDTDVQRTVASESNEEGFAVLTLIPSFSFAQLDSTQLSNGAKAVLPTTMNPGVKLKWSNVFGNTEQAFTSSVVIGMQRISMQDAPSRTYETQSANFGELGVALSNGRREIRAELFLGVEERAFLRAITDTRISLQKIVEPKVALTLATELMKYGRFTELLQAGGTLLFPGRTEGFQTKMGTAFNVGLLSEHDLRNFRLFNRIFYNYSDQNSLVSKQVNMEIGIEMGVSLRFD